MNKVALSVVVVLAVIYAVPFVVYGLASVVVGLKTPQGVWPARFLTGVFVSKRGEPDRRPPRRAVMRDPAS